MILLLWKKRWKHLGQWDLLLFICLSVLKVRWVHNKLSFGLESAWSISLIQSGCILSLTNFLFDSNKIFNSYHIIGFIHCSDLSFKTLLMCRADDFPISSSNFSSIQHIGIANHLYWLARVEIVVVRILYNTFDQLIWISEVIATITSNVSTMRASNNQSLARRGLATIPTNKRYSSLIYFSLHEDLIAAPNRENLVLMSSMLPTEILENSARQTLGSSNASAKVF